MDDDRRRQIALGLMQDHQQARGAELLERASEAEDPAYWAGLCPGLSVGGAPGGSPAAELPAAAVERFHAEGYFRAEGLVAPARAADLAGAVQRVADAGWAPLFALVYDEFWELPWSSPVRTVAETLLGGEARLLPNVAVHLVDAGARRSGWRPHRDGHGMNGRVTTWVALTEATTENGCIFVVPRTPTATDALDAHARHEPSFEEVQTLLHEVRALPASPGTVMAWGFDLLHWGSVAHAPEHPRISVAYEWIAPGAPATDEDEPILGLSEEAPAFEQRLALIARALLSYPDFDAELGPYAALARRLASAS